MIWKKYKWIWKKSSLEIGWEFINMEYYKLLYIHLLIVSIQIYTPFKDNKNDKTNNI